MKTDEHRLGDKWATVWLTQLDADDAELMAFAKAWGGDNFPNVPTIEKAIRRIRGGH